MKNFQYFFNCAVAFVLLEQVLVAESSTVSSSSLRRSSSSSDNKNGNNKRLISFPLTPHRERVRQRGLNEIDGEVLLAASQRAETERGTYRRRRLDRPAMPYEPDEGSEGEHDEQSVVEKSIDALYQGYGTHYVDLWVGTPPQRVTVIVDTGSSVTAFPCQECTNCGTGYHVDEYFQEDQSETFMEVSCDDCILGRCGISSPLCEVSVSYQEGSSWRAYEATDIVYSGGPHDAPLNNTSEETRSFRMHFGCQTHLTGLFKTQLADGIMGMEMTKTSYWKQMLKEEAMEVPQFSLCFTRADHAEREGTNAGAMTMGGTDPRLHDNKMVYAEQGNKHGWYTVEVKAIYLRTGGGDRAMTEVADENSNSTKAVISKVQISEHDLNNGKIIIDSGTTDTYLGSKLHGPFSDEWMAVVGTKYKNSPVELTTEQLKELPTLLFQIKGWSGGTVDPNSPNLVGDLDPENPNDILVAMPATHYMEYSHKDEAYTSRLYFNEHSGGVLGANFMMGHDILFDVENERIGFAESNCDYAVVSDAQVSD